MNEPSAPTAATNRRLSKLGAAGLLALLSAMACSAYCQLFTTFRFWDDEGYVLISLRNFAAGGKLYADVFSQYGPVYNLLFALLHRFVALPLDTNSTRWITLTAWLCSVVAAAGLVRQLSRSWTWAIAAGLGIFFQLRTLTHEPLHPVGLISVLLTTGATLAVGSVARRNAATGCMWAAIAGVLLALVKINVGLFYLAGLGTFVLWKHGGPLSRPWARGGLTLLAVLAGSLLLRPLLHETWVREFFVVYALAACTTLATIAITLEHQASMPPLLRPVMLAAVGTGTVVFLLSLAAGIDFSSLVDGVLRAPLRLAINFSFPFRWARLTLSVLGSNAIAFFLWLLLRSKQPPWADRLVALGRVTVGAGLLLSYFHGFAVSVEAYLLSFGLGFLWALAAPLGECPEDNHAARQLLSLLALFQILHVFPVAGTQLNLGTLLLAVLVFVSLAEVSAWSGAKAWSRPKFFLVVLALAFPAWGFGRLTRAAAHDYFCQPPETFARAGLHLSPWQTSALAVLTANSRQNADMLFSLPGLFSFNLWSELPAPTQQNITQWWSLLDEAKQTEIIAKLERAARPVVIVQRNLITAGLAKTSFHPSPLTRYIDEHFTEVFSIDSYEFLARRGAHIEPLLIARWQPGASPATFRFHFAGGEMSAARRIEFRHYGPHLDESVATVTAFSLTAATPSTGGLTPWDCQLTLPIRFSRSDCDAARIYDDAGKLLMELRFERRKPQANPE